MTTRMLIDARHAEETRVAVLQGNRIEEFDFESAEHKQIKGNIYLAKVTRVEPSLQAAFVDFGGNRHGFLAFSEIHPDYYQIPKQDREALIAEEAAQAAEEEALRAAEDAEDEEGDFEAGEDDQEGDLGSVIEIDTSEKDQVSTIEAGHVEDDFHDGDEHGTDEHDAVAQDAETGEGSDSEDRAEGEDSEEGDAPRRGRRQGRARSKQAEELRDRRMALRRRYKIQDVIQRRQVLLVQVVKEERGNKGAALTTYLSLAGRYCVLMPNSTHGGGISRKISSASDRKRLKQIVSELELPRSMGCIVRTAGLARTKTEIKRDFDYLARLWDEIRENTLKSSAPALIHSDSDLIKRAIRDIYNREIEEVVVEGADGFHAARAFMKLLMPSHGKKVRAYADPVPLFQRYGAEDQLTAMYDPVVQLRSGGYIVINPTEALVSIDINSGRSTKEYGIEATALNTNLEAAREIARQLRLRDMAGLVVIDFIDMEHGSSVRKVEKAMKDALKNDRARIQVGRISGFGLMEMSRQRLRTGVLEASTRICPHCDGTGLVRTASSAGLAALRLIEDEAAKGRGTVITLFASTEASIYLLNVKRADLGEIEYRYGVRVEVIPEGEDEGAKMRVGSSGPRPENPPRFDPIVVPEEDFDEEIEEDELDEELEEAREEETRERDGRGERRSDERGDDEGRRKRRKRRRGGRDRDREQAPAGDEQAEGGDVADTEEDADVEAEMADSDMLGIEPAGEGEADAETGEDDEAPRKRRRRGRRRRGGRRFDEAGEGVEGAAEVGEADAGKLDAGNLDAGGADAGEQADIGSDTAATDEGEPSETMPPAMGTEESFPAAEGALDADSAVERAESQQPEAAGEVATEAAPAPKPRRTRRKPGAAVDAVVDAGAGGDGGEAVASDTSAAAAETPAKAPRTRRRKADATAVPDGAELTPTDTAAPAEPAPEPEVAIADGAELAPAEAKPKRTRRRKADAVATEASVADAPAAEQPAITTLANDLAVQDAAPAEPEAQADEPAQAADAPVAQAEPAEAGPARRGWWQRTFGG